MYDVGRDSRGLHIFAQWGTWYYCSRPNSYQSFPQIHGRPGINARLY